MNGDMFDAGLSLTHSGTAGGTLAVTFDNLDTTGSKDVELGTLTSTGDTTVTIASTGGGVKNAIYYLAETDNHLTTVTVTGNDAFVMDGAVPSQNGVDTDAGLAAAATATTTQSSLTLIDASAVTATVTILAGDNFIPSANNTVSYTGLTIKGGSGNADALYNGATNGVIIDGNGHNDAVGLGGSGASATLGTGAHDSAQVGFDWVTNAAVVVGGSLGDSVTFGAGATATLMISQGAQIATASTVSLGQTTEHGSVAGGVVDLTSVVGASTTVVAANVSAATSLTNAENIAAEQVGAQGVAYFLNSGNEYVVATHAADPGGVTAGDAIVELTGANFHGLTLAAGLLHLA